MIKLDGWDGPVSLAEGAYRYSRTASWKRLYIEISDRDPLEVEISCIEDLAAYLERCAEP
jgi:hypothetical protein